MAEKKPEARKLLLLLLIVTVAGAALLCIRACPHWRAADLHPPVSEMPPRDWIDPDGMTQETRILPPEGCTRIPAEEGSFLAYMRGLPLLPDGSAVCEYDGTPLSANNAAAVYDISVGAEGYQQCADSIIRLWSDWFRETGQTERLAYHLTNGELCRYSDWTRGRRVLALGSFSVQLPIGRHGDSEQTYRNWLCTVMRYAGTLSLEAESETISASELETGDIFCHGGAPGHAVIVADEARDSEGNRWFLLAQGFTPAQNLHILTGYRPDNFPWYTEEELSGDEIRLSSYTFTGSERRRRNGWSAPS